MLKWLNDHLQLSLMILVVLGLIPGLALATYNVLVERQESRAEVRLEAKELAARFSYTEKQVFDEANQLLADISELPALQASDWEACQVEFAEKLQEYPAYANFGVIGLDGYVLCSGQTFDQPVYAGDRTYFLRALENDGFAIGDYQIGRITGLPSINFGYPLRDETGEPTAVLFGALQLEWMSDVIQAAELPQGATVTLFDRQGVILAHQPDPQSWIGLSLADTSLAASMSELMSDRVVEATGLDGVHRLLAASAPPDVPGELFFVVGVPLKVAFAGADQTLLRSLGLLGLTTLIGLGMAYWLGTHLIPRDEFEQRLHNQQLLNALSQMMLSLLNAHTPEEIYRAVGDEMAKLGFKAAVLVSCEEGKYLRLPYLSFLPALQKAVKKLTGLSLHKHHIPLEPGNFFHDLLKNGEAVYSRPFTPVIAAALPEKVSPLADQVARLIGLKQGITVPMQVNNMPYGVMMITGTNLSEDDLPAINTFANQTDLALENVLRMEAIQRQASDLQTSEQRFRSLFENAPIALWEEDFSAAREYLSKLQGTGVKDFRVYFKEHPEAVQECAALVEIKAVNGRTVELFQARDKIQLLEGLPQIFHPESYFIFQEELLALLEGQRYFTTQAVNHTLTGKPMHILLELHFLEGSKESWGRVIVSTIDISPLVNAQEQIQLEADRTTALLRTSACLNAGLELPLVLKVVCEEAAQILNTPVVTLSLYDEETERFYHGADYGLPAEYGQRAQPVPRRYVDELIEQAPAKMEGLAQRQMIVQFDTSDAPNAELYAQYNLSGQVSIALLHDGKLLGRINLHSVGGFRELTVEEIALLGGLADQAAQAISNAQLFSQAQRHLNQVQALRDIDLAIIGSVDLRITLNIVLDQTMNQLAVDAVDILLYNSKTQTLDFMDEHGFLTEALRHTRLRLGEGNAGRVAMERKALYIPDLKKRQTDFLRSPLLQQEGFIDYYALPLISKGQIKGVMELFQRSPRYHDQEWRNFAEIFSTQAAIAIDSTQLFEDLQRNNIELARAYDTTLEGWARALELRDKETEGHARRVVEMTERMAREMAISADEMVHLRRGSLLHDIGKMGVPDSILLKTGSLTEDEWEIMRQHPVYAWNLLSPISYLRPALDIPYCHHEKWDGTGYPRGLRGEEIPLPARIFAIVDVWDALNSDRPYRKAWQEEMVLEYLKEQAGKHFDPQVVEVFLKILTDNNLPRKS